MKGPTNLEVKHL